MHKAVITAPLLLALTLALPSLVSASSLIPSQNYLARIGDNSPKELLSAFTRIEQLLVVETQLGEYAPVVMVLHGPEASIFLRKNYSQHKHLVDLAARLTAFGVVDIRVCETRMAALDEPLSGLMPFVSTVEFGPAEIDRLVGREGYLDF
jgi:intracellular sulfur oxidation DsrE/DsrF family protein